MPNVIIIAVFQRVVAQGLAHLVRDQGVGGSNPLCPTRIAASSDAAFPFHVLSSLKR